MNREVVLLRRRLQQDGLCLRPFVLIGYVLLWDCPELGFREVLRGYASFVDDAPERVHAELCRRLLAAGKEIGPEEYFRRLKKEMVVDEDRIPS